MSTGSGCASIDRDVAHEGLLGSSFFYVDRPCESYSSEPSSSCRGFALKKFCQWCHAVVSVVLRE